jgi:type II secretion system protein G
MKRVSKGFTLVELLVVIAIIGILATIILVSLGTARRRARDARRISDIRQIALALQLFREDNTAYPQNAYAATGSLIPTYVRAVPTDPNGGNYLYGVDNATSAQNYVLGATLEVGTSQVLTDPNDIDGTVYVINCADPVYCIQSQ